MSASQCWGYSGSVRGTAESSTTVRLSGGGPNGAGRAFTAGWTGPLNGDYSPFMDLKETITSPERRGSEGSPACNTGLDNTSVSPHHGRDQLYRKGTSHG
ncbi:hypothetical protein GCM10009639_22520 [Kitasatospora putterlickiae]|uniref:Uncharacterized protein n=1 Tax=Kitasatospora putterlickiae TaxID=221725 RepID=A0ABP4IJ22_9ACTN